MRAAPLLLPLLLACSADAPATLELVDYGDPVPTFHHPDANPTSPFYGQELGPDDVQGTASAWYFGHANCPYCSAQFGELDTIANELAADGVSVRILGLNEVGYADSNAIITEGRDLPWLQPDTAATWQRWGAVWRDLYLVDADGTWVAKVNLTSFDLTDEANALQLRADLEALAEGTLTAEGLGETGDAQD